MKNQKYLFLAITTIIALSLFRLIPHPPNFTPIFAISVFAGIKFKDNLFSYLVPVFAMLVSDAIIGFHSGMIIIYVAIVFSAYIARKSNTINSSVLSSCILFFFTIKTTIVSLAFFFKNFPTNRTFFTNSFFCYYIRICINILI